jgi:hypothetical protein
LNTSWAGITSLNDDQPGDIAHSSKSSMNVWVAVRTRVPAPSQRLGGPESATAPLLPPLPLAVPPLLLPLPLPPELVLLLPLVLPLLVLPVKPPLPLVLPLDPPLVLPPKEPPLLPLVVLPLPDPPPLLLLLLTGLDGVPEQPRLPAAAAKKRNATTTRGDRCNAMFMWIPYGQ